MMAPAMGVSLPRPCPCAFRSSEFQSHASRCRQIVAWSRNASVRLQLRKRDASAPPPTGRPPVFFLHPHRGGGTTLCALAVAAGERPDSPANNCLLLPGDGGGQWGCFGDSNRDLSCGLRLAYHREQRVTFGARETWMEAREPGRRAPHPLRAPLCAGFLYVTILRNPLARIAADYCMSEHDRANPFEVLARANRAFDAMADARDAAGEAFAGARASNYYVRILLGERISTSRPPTECPRGSQCNAPCIRRGDHIGTTRAADAVAAAQAWLDRRKCRGVASAAEAESPHPTGLQSSELVDLACGGIPQSEPARPRALRPLAWRDGEANRSDDGPPTSGRSS
jgi:hypothetical protein